MLGTDGELQDAESHVMRYKPEGLESLCRTTKFSRKELQILYRGFKQVSLLFQSVRKYKQVIAPMIETINPRPPEKDC